jgi:hypothetical protein
VNNDSTWDVVARQRATDNGYAGNLIKDQVWVFQCNDPDRLTSDVPLNCGAYENNANYIEVIILSHVNTTFAKVFGFDKFHNLVQAVALTKKGGPLYNGASIVSLDPHPNCGNGSVDVGGNGTINLNGGGIFVNSNASCGYSQSSCSVTLNISSGGISSAGSPIDINGCSGAGLTTDTTQTQVVVPDEVYMPAKPDECTQTPSAAFKVGSVWHLNPGYYASFPPSSLGNGKDIVMESGVYCVGSSISWGGNDFNSLTGTSGVTFYIKTGNSFGFNINSSINLDASNSGPYAGYLVILDGNQNNLQSCTINGGGNIIMNGTIFTPYCNVTINGNSSSAAPFNAQVIGWDVKLNGNNTINFTYDPGDNATNNRRVGLMK